MKTPRGVGRRWEGTQSGLICSTSFYFPFFQSFPGDSNRQAGGSPTPCLMPEPAEFTACCPPFDFLLPPLEFPPNSSARHDTCSSKHDALVSLGIGGSSHILRLAYANVLWLKISLSPLSLVLILQPLV